jgi:hypothetical protein
VGAKHHDAIFAHVTQSFVPGLAKAARLGPGQCVPDVATGTGVAAQAAAAMDLLRCHPSPDRAKQEGSTVDRIGGVTVVVL